MKKAAAILLCLCMMLGMASCGKGANGDTPDGMQIASCAGADYYLYVPTTWNVNTYYGISGAYFNLNKSSNVSVVKYEIDDALKGQMEGVADADRLDWYYTSYCKPAAEAIAWKGTIEEVTLASSALTIGGANARQYRAKMTVSGSSVIRHCVIAEKNNAFYVLTFTLDESLFERLWENASAMINAFKFTDTPYAPKLAKPLTDDPNAPKGMKRASNDEVAYVFYVPTDWSINQNERIFSAYVEGDRTNVSVIPYMPDAESLSIDQFIAMTKDQMINTGLLDAAAEVGIKECKLGDRVAKKMRYTLTIGGETYEYVQVVAAYKSMIYSVTYTADPAHFDAHMQEFDSIVAAFRFI